MADELMRKRFFGILRTAVSNRAKEVQIEHTPMALVIRMSDGQKTTKIPVEPIDSGLVRGILEITGLDPQHTASYQGKTMAARLGDARVMFKVSYFNNRIRIENIKVEAPNVPKVEETKNPLAREFERQKAVTSMGAVNPNPVTPTKTVEPKVAEPTVKVEAEQKPVQKKVVETEVLTKPMNPEVARPVQDRALPKQEVVHPVNEPKSIKLAPVAPADPVEPKPEIKPEIKSEAEKPVTEPEKHTFVAVPIAEPPKEMFKPEPPVTDKVVSKPVEDKHNDPLPSFMRDMEEPPVKVEKPSTLKFNTEVAKPSTEVKTPATPSNEVKMDSIKIEKNEFDDSLFKQLLDDNTMKVKEEPEEEKSFSDLLKEFSDNPVVEKVRSRDQELDELINSLTISKVNSPKEEVEAKKIPQFFTNKNNLEPETPTQPSNRETEKIKEDLKSTKKQRRLETIKNLLFEPVDDEEES